ncbi:MAG: sugar phosphate isomerase/epimerase [Patescibacteria group bacterium]
MDNNQLKFCAKGSRRSGWEFIEETGYLASLVDCLEIDFNYPHDRNFHRELTYLKQLRLDRGMDFTVHAPYLSGSLNDLNDNIRQETLRQIFYSIDCAAQIGAKIVTLHPALEPYGLRLVKLPEIELNSYKKISDYARKKKIKIGLENEAQTCFWFPDRACRLGLLLKTVRQINKKNFGLTLDIGHANVSGEDYLAAIKDHHSQIFHIHAHDNLGGPEKNLRQYHRPDPHLAPGRGRIDWPGVIRSLKKVNYSGYLEIECESREIAKSLKYLKSL